MGQVGEEGRVAEGVEGGGEDGEGVCGAEEVTVEVASGDGKLDDGVGEGQHQVAIGAVPFGTLWPPPGTLWPPPGPLPRGGGGLTRAL